MSSLDFTWESFFASDAPPGCVLKAALFTTYDRADERLLAEHLLPRLLQLNHELVTEGTERQYFLVELDNRLKQLHNKLVVVSSTVREEPTNEKVEGSGTYGWIWRSIRQLTVGRKGKAVQHAKLWLLHWGASGDSSKEYLEIVVSSANLTRSAFKDQLQAGWRVCLPLDSNASQDRMKSWGILPQFLRDLAESAGDQAHFESFVNLLNRAKCPRGVAFVASAPGRFTAKDLRSVPWGSAGLRKIAPPGRGDLPVSVSILSPFIGSWSRDSLRDWCSAYGGSPTSLSLVWIDKNHPIAQQSRWILPKSTLTTLDQSGCTLLQLKNGGNDAKATDVFHENHLPTDPRWSHAKVYGFKRGNSHRLLVTSANFSAAAWGSKKPGGILAIENFELGVCIQNARWPLGKLVEFENLKGIASESKPQVRTSSHITWAQATWDGKYVTIECRCERKQALTGKLLCGDKWFPITKWRAGADHLLTARVAWKDTSKQPSVARLTCGKEEVSVAVFDARPRPEREHSAPPEVDADLAQQLRDNLLFEQYGGSIASDEAKAPASDDNQEGSTSSSSPDDYSVTAFVLARQHSHVVDCWALKMQAVQNRDPEDFEQQMLLRDGEMLVKAFERCAASGETNNTIGAKLAAEELAERLKSLSKT